MINPFRAASCPLVLAAFCASAQTPSFTIAALPDTQFYSENSAWTYHFNNQTNWIVARRDLFNIQFVTHLGDIVQNGASRVVEWERADAAMDILDGNLPYIACCGNHDYDSVSNKANGASMYLTWFGPQRWQPQAEYLGSAVSGLSHATRLVLNGREYLHLSLEWRPDQPIWDWAAGMIDQYPEAAVIISTHEHVRDHNNDGQGMGRTTAGIATWNGLIRMQPRIFMVLNGHNNSADAPWGGEFVQVTSNAAGSEVFEMLSDFQRWSEGGTGYLRLLEFDEWNSLITARTFSPSTNRYETDANSFMRYPMDFGQRLGGSAAPTIETIRFRQGVAGYAGAQDTEIRSGQPDSSQSGAAYVYTSDDEGAGLGDRQSLIRFDDIFGDAPGQIGPDQDVMLAKIRFNVIDPGSGVRLHRMLRDWSELATWNSLGGGISTDGIEALAAPDAFAGGSTTISAVPQYPLELDVTAALRAMRHGGPNFGWALLPFDGGSNPVGLVSSNNFTISARPELIVTVASRPVTTRTFQNGAGGYTGARDTEVQENAPLTQLNTAPAIKVDSDDPNGTGRDTQVLLKFEDIFGQSAQQIPAGSRITSATLVLQVLDEGSGFTLHRMLRPWTDGMTWLVLVNGVSANDAEALLEAEVVAGVNGSAASVRTGPLHLDVTDALRKWHAGALQEGWVFRPWPSGSNAVQFASSEATNVAHRPKLIVGFVAPCAADLSGSSDPQNAAYGTPDGTVDASDFFYFLDQFASGNLSVADRSGSPDPADPAYGQPDGVIDAADFFYYLDLFVTGCA